MHSHSYTSWALATSATLVALITHLPTMLPRLQCCRDFDSELATIANRLRPLSRISSRSGLSSLKLLQTFPTVFYSYSVSPLGG